ncbi:hypothetical protein COCSUDRAFT_58221 [Coccomyxa subellipsoidea C-169]|uniref:Uncharacterized protein n=1 Tax=Coccomyxa subellipsoidea (strain C-169) TaxID=574566 RepID=I0YNL8_COCSC|nr:hypothetical protein COCSUDRAFT_58221 [Coccomyxa subellipsoidea C-169]EIE19987.1 hypothetical protein COCSUDRAFT_58221 [Coccomyxa subellipsoidea C-169]|eukprot:XP_005644531.1 hypothetical protein COCSUDRAFT_58221 [Coccomyxa subellipsoidea C-169]
MQPPNDVMRAKVLHDLGSVLCSLQRGYEAEQLHRGGLLAELEAQDPPASSAAIAQCKRSLAEAIMAEVAAPAVGGLC